LACDPLIAYGILKIITLAVKQKRRAMAILDLSLTSGKINRYERKGLFFKPLAVLLGVK
jgi:hypothetical protein